MSFRRFSIFLIALLAIELCHGQLSREELDDQLKKIQEFRGALEAEFKNPEESPLEDDSIPNFKGNDFFPVNETFIFKAKYEPIKKGRLFEMKTTTDRAPYYQDYAIISFAYERQEYQMHAYRNIELSKEDGYEDYLFLPFKDRTNGIESYGGGRYIDLKRPDEDVQEIILDFNQSYNPYCAYNPKYSCPVPPKENHLEIKIEAGIKMDH